MKVGALWIVGTLLALLAASLLFRDHPLWDIRTSSLFYVNGHFRFEKSGVDAWVSTLVHDALNLSFAIFALMGMTRWVRGRLSGDQRRAFLFIVLSVGLSAGVVTNLVLKDHWGRARPTQTTLFGGTKQFSLPWTISDQCESNCSFVGGDVSFAFCALAPALCSRRRRLWVPAALAFGSFVAVIRIAAGAHFLSDCVIGALLTTAIVLALHTMAYRKEPDILSP